MAFYKNSEQFYIAAQALFDRLLQENSGAATSVEEAKLLIGLKCTEPAAEILINGRRRPATITYGKNRLRPEVNVELKTDNLHRILLGELTLSNALSSKYLVVRGRIWKTLALADLFLECQAIYPIILREQGLS